MADTAYRDGLGHRVWFGPQGMVWATGRRFKSCCRWSVWCGCWGGVPYRTRRERGREGESRVLERRTHEDAERA